MDKFQLLITCPKGLEETLKREIIALDVYVEKLTVGGVFVETDLSGIYSCLMHLRVANRILLKFYKDRMNEAADLTTQASQFQWANHFSVDNTIAIHFKGQDSQIRNTMYGAQAIKDGINDYFRSVSDRRITVAKKDPDILIHAYLKNGWINVYIDLWGKSLHQRGYRAAQGDAPLKENLASGLLNLADWSKFAEHNQALIDPF